MDIGEMIRVRRLELGLTLEEVGKAVSVGKSTVKKWENGSIANMGRDKISTLAGILEVDPVLFITDESNINFPPPRSTTDYTTFPVIGEIAAGYDNIAIEEWDGDVIDIPNTYLKSREKSEFFVLRVKGESMYPLYQDGDKVLILKCSSLDYSGQIGAVLYDDELTTIKRVEYDEKHNWVKLVPINPNVPPITIKGERCEHCRILGIPKLLIREIN